MKHTLITSLLLTLLLAPLAALHAADAPKQRPDNVVMLAGYWLPEDPHQIDYEKLPRVEAEHAIISDVRDHGGTRVHQHAYLAHHDGRFWAMWSDGPGGPRRGVTPEQHRNVVPAHDMPGTRNSFATSKDGLHWTTPADLTGPPRIKGYGWIARGLWKRDGELLALASHFDAPGYAGLGLSLEAFRWNGTKWVAHGTVLDDSMNNFPPKRLPSGEWMMTRRDHQRQVSVMIGGTKAFNDWRINPLAAYDGKGRPEEPYWYILPDGKTIVGLIRDNGRSKFLLRTFSRDNGKTWSEMHRTNFPDATSKFFVHRTSRGYYVMVSNSNPRQRDPLTFAPREVRAAVADHRHEPLRQPCDETIRMRRLECGLVDQPAAGAVDDHHAGLHLVEGGFVDHPHRIFQLGHMDSNVIGPFIQAVQIDALEARFLDLLRRDKGIVDNDVHPQAPGPVGNDGADLAESNHTEYLIKYLPSLKLFLLPETRFQGCGTLGNVS